MTHLSRAIEAGARALCIAAGDDPDQLTYAREMHCTGNDREKKQRWQYWISHAAAVITAYEAHLMAGGLVVVPAIPTPAMIDAGVRDTDPSPQGDSWYRPIDLTDEQAEQCYRAMIAASQEPSNAVD